MATMSIREFRERLAKLGAGGATTVLRRVLAETALDAEAEGKLNATSRMNVITGRLRGSIRSKVTQSPGGLELRLRAGNRSVRYARIQELGGVTWNGGVIRPKFYLRDGLDAAGRRLPGRLETALTDALRLD